MNNILKEADDVIRQAKITIFNMRVRITVLEDENAKLKAELDYQKRLNETIIEGLLEGLPE